MSTRRIPRRRVVAIALALAGILLLAGCGTSSAESSDTSKPASTGTGATAQLDLSDVTLVVAQNGASKEYSLRTAGVWDDIPYKLEYATFPSPSGVIEALNAQAADVGAGVGDTTLTLAQGNAAKQWTKENVPFTTIAMQGWRDPVKYPPYATIVRTDAGINSPKDLEGRKWAYNPGGNNQVNFLLTLDHIGLTQDDVEPVILDGYQAAIAAFQNGDVDALSTAQYLALPLIEAGIGKIIVGSQEIGQDGYSSIIARTDVLQDEKKVAAIADYITRLDKAQAFFEQNPDAEKDVLVHDGQKPETAEISLKTGPGRYFPITSDIVAREQKIADALSKAGVLKQSIDVSIAYTEQFNGSLTAYPADKR